jgi:integrase
VVKRPPGSSNPSPRPDQGAGRRRGLVTFTRPLPRYVIAKKLTSGVAAFYFNIPTVYRKLGCPVPNEPLGTDYVMACGEDGKGGLAAALNARLDEWDALRRGQPVSGERTPSYGTVDWLFMQYKQSKAYLEKVAPRSRPDYERTMLLVADMVTKKGDRVGDRRIRSITPVSADRVYEIIIAGPRGARLRQGEKGVALCRRAWRVVHRLYPAEFDQAVPNPWDGVTRKRRTKKTKAAVTRDQVYAFAWGCIDGGHPEAAAAAVICFEWLQRPENVLAGYLRWTDYRNEEWPSAIKIEHHKTGAVVWHPLEEQTNGAVTKFYEDAEAVLARLPRRGVSMILRQVTEGVTKPYSFSGMQKIVHTMRDRLGLPSMFTLDACRHGGMTELEEAELTDGQGRALSAHKSQQAYEGYAKRTMERALSATRKRHAHRLANTAGTSIQNEPQNGIQNDPEKNESGSTK